MEDKIGGNNNEMVRKVKAWLSEEGYPLEFFVANTFRQAGFSSHQGRYVRDGDTKTVREIDVEAAITEHISEHEFIRIYHVIECKWSKGKPWIIFSSPSSHMAHSACISQTMGTKLGRSLIWCIAGNDSLHKSTTTARGGGLKYSPERYHHF